MTIDEFRNALKGLLNDAARSRLPIPELLRVADEELRPQMDEM